MVVFITAFTGRETLDGAKEAEPFGYIVKPFDEQDLRTVIEMALFKHRVGGQRRPDRRLESRRDSHLRLHRGRKSSASPWPC